MYSLVCSKELFLIAYWAAFSVSTYNDLSPSPPHELLKIQLQSLQSWGSGSCPRGLQRAETPTSPMSKHRLQCSSGWQDRDKMCFPICLLNLKPSICFEELLILWIAGFESIVSRWHWAGSYSKVALFLMVHTMSGFFHCSLSW